MNPGLKRDYDKNKFKPKLWSLAMPSTRLSRE